MRINLKNNIDKLGTVGLFLTAIFSPCCFPLFAFAASTFGLGSFELFGGWTMWVFQIMTLVSIGGLLLNYRNHKNITPTIISLISGGLIIYSFNFYNGDNWTTLLYIGMFGLLIATGLNYYINRNSMTCKTCGTYNGKTVELSSTITCPNCGHSKAELMPTDACVYFYECDNCKARLKPLQGDCCVYCSYGTIKCPPIQSGETCC